MAMRVVADAALTQPDGVANAQPLAERTLVRLAIEPGVAHLLVREKPLFRHEKSSFPVGLDAASLEHDGEGTLLRSEEHTSELQSRQYLVCRLLLEKKKNHIYLLTDDEV